MLSTQNKLIMEATVRERDGMPMMYEPMDTGKSFYTIEEFMDKLAKRLGKHYGLNDIREVL